MVKLLDNFEKKKLTLIVSLPDNDIEFAKAAIAGGADALKVHCNIQHKASGVSFGSFAQEKTRFEQILKIAKIPVGIVPGAQVKPTEADMKEAVKMGFDYFDMNVDDIPAFMLGIKNITKIAAVDGKQSMDKVVHLKASHIDGLEAAIVPHLGYGQNLTVGDLQYYISLAISSALPVIVPTQRRIEPDEIPILADTGVKSVMIGAIVTGKTAASIEEATRNFKEAIDQL